MRFLWPSVALMLVLWALVSCWPEGARANGALQDDAVPPSFLR